MNHIVILRTYNSPTLLKQFLESFLEQDCKNNKVILGIVDDSSNHNALSSNKKVAKSILNNQVTCYYINNKLATKDSLLTRLSESLKIPAADVFQLFTSSYKTPNYLDSEKTLLSCGGTNGSWVASQLLALSIIKKHELNQIKTIVTLYDDDIILHELKVSKGEIKEVKKDYITYRNTHWTNDTLISYGKYYHHHGNTLTCLQRDLYSINSLLIHKYIICCHNKAIKFPIFEDGKYKYVTPTAILNTKMPRVIKSILNRASILSPILPTQFSIYKKDRHLFDEGNVSIRADVLLAIPFIPYFTLSILLNTYIKNLPNFSSKSVLIEPAVINRRPEQDSNDTRNYLKSSSTQLIPPSLMTNTKVAFFEYLAEFKVPFLPTNRTTNTETIIKINDLTQGEQCIKQYADLEYFLATNQHVIPKKLCKSLKILQSTKPKTLDDSESKKIKNRDEIRARFLFYKTRAVLGETIKK